jgi:hypothetical protein
MSQALSVLINFHLRGAGLKQKKQELALRIRYNFLGGFPARREPTFPTYSISNGRPQGILSRGLKFDANME